MVSGRVSYRPGLILESVFLWLTETSSGKVSYPPGPILESVFLWLIETSFGAAMWPLQCPKPLNQFTPVAAMPRPPWAPVRPRYVQPMPIADEVLWAVPSGNTSVGFGSGSILRSRQLF